MSQRFGRDVCDVTDRQLHWTRIEDVPEIWARLGAVSLTTDQTCGRRHPLHHRLPPRRRRA
jgi:sulfite reductase (ferredoxin)